jgi:glyoxylase-like metal-dependent hydrolase (beta-lactamase superfamily II)
MEKIPIPEQDVVPLDAIAADISGLRIMMVNVFGIGRLDSDWTLIDAGLPHSTERIQKWAGELFGELNAPTSIVLTHGHFDHVGALKDLAQGWDVPVYAHALEAPYLTGEKEYPPPDPKVGGGLLALMSPLYPRGPVNISSHLQLLPQDGTVPGLSEWRWIHTPGHTDGHVSFYRERDRILIAGDAVSTTKAESLLAIATQRPELHGPPAYYTSDWDAAKRSVEKLAELRPFTVAAGHGKPMAGAEVADALMDLAIRFDEVARPKRGRYAHGAD